MSELSKILVTLVVGLVRVFSSVNFNISQEPVPDEDPAYEARHDICAHDAFVLPVLGVEALMLMIPHSQDVLSRQFLFVCV